LRTKEQETRLTLHEHGDDEKYKITEIQNLCVCFKECVSLERLKTGYESDDSDKLRKKLSLCPPRKHMGKKRCAPLILNLGSRCREVASITQRPLYREGKSLLLSIA